MKQTITNYFRLLTGILLLLIGLNTSTLAQSGVCNLGGCTGGFAWQSGFSTTSSAFANGSSGQFAGEFSTYNVTLGSTYEWSLCTIDGATTGTNSDPTMTLRTPGGTVLCYADDVCGLQPKILWTATFTGTVEVLIMAFPCNTLSTSHTTRWRCSSCSGGGPVDPCTAITTAASCATANITNLAAGSGFAGYSFAPFTTPGNEKIYTYTPPTTGTYSITGIHTGGYYVDMFWKPVSGGCNTLGWTYINDFFTGATETTVGIALTAGVPVYFMVDDEDTNPSSLNWTINCPGAFNPCASIVNIASCGTTISASWAAGAGAWTGYGGPFGTPGQEKIFTFTPTVTGGYTVTTTTTAGSGTWIDFFYKAASVGCNTTGWTFVNDLTTGEVGGPITLTAGVTYYFLFDPEATTAITRNIVVSCAGANPCTSIGTLPACGITTSVSWPAGSGSWTGFGGPFGTPGVEKIFTFTPAVTGGYTVTTTTTAGSGTWIDFFYKLASAGCSNTGWTYVNDLTSGEVGGPIALTGGVTYYFLFDPEGTTAITRNVVVGCPAADPCTLTIPNIPACGSTVSYNITGAGSWNPATGTCFSAFQPGTEQLYTFTPAVSGNYSITGLSSTISFTNYVAFKPVSAGCSITGWTCWTSFFGTSSGTTTAALIGGVPYYVLLDGSSATPYSGTFTIDCPAPDPCTLPMVNIPNCGVNVSATWNSGPGAWSAYGGPFTTPGKEVIFTFTPTITGGYQLVTNTTSGSGTFIDFFIKPMSAGCSVTGWTYLNDMVSGEISAPINLTAGTTYMFLGDPEATTAITRNVMLMCPPTITSFAPTSGCPGQTITITGTGFMTGPANPTSTTGVNSVTFGGVSASGYIVVNNTTITATVPQGALSGAIVVHQGGIPGGTDVPSTPTFSFVPPPAATATVANNPVCPGNPIILSATSSLPPASVSSSFGFAGSYAPGTWNTTWTPVGANGTVDASGAPASITINGPDATVFDARVRWGHTFPAGATVSFNWNYTTIDGPNYDRPVYIINGSELVMTGFNIAGTQTQSGTVNISVPAGALLELAMWAVDGCCGYGNVTITNFTVTSATAGFMWQGPNGYTSNVLNNSIPNASATNVGTYTFINSDGTCTNVITIPVLLANSAVPSITSTPPGASVCPGDAITLNGSILSSNYSLAPIPYAPATTAGIPIVLGDDQLSGIIPMGFPFVFFGNTYTDTYVSSNGFLAFNSFAGSGCCTGQFLPDAFDPNDVIALAWEDLYPPAGGSITYSTQGVAPNRQFIVSYNNIQHFSAGNPVTMQVILYETTNNIEMHMTTMPSDGGLHTMGIENADGTIALTVAGRNQSNWSVGVPEAWRFSPETIISSGWTVPFGPAVTGLNVTIPSANANYVGTYTFSIVSSTGCNSVATANLTLKAEPSAFSPVTNAVCEGQGMFLNQFGIGATTYSWTGPSGYFASGSFPGAPTLVTSNGTIGIHDGQYRLIVYNADGCRDTSYTQFDVNPNPIPVLAALDSVTCPGFNDGVFTVGVNSGTAPFSWEYNSGLGNFDLSSNGTFPEDPINLGSLYVIEDFYDVLVSDVNGCTGSLIVTVGTEENEAPQWTSTPSNIVLSNDAGNCNAIVSWPVPTWTDDCPGTTMAQTAGFGNSAAFPIGTTTVTYVVTDVGDANSAPLSISHSFNVTVNDNEFPSVVGCPVNNLDYCNPVTWTPPTFTDNCAGMVVVSTHNPGVTLPVGPTTVTYTATDAAGNITTCSFVVNRLSESVVADTVTSNREFHNICLGEDITMTVGGGSLGAGASWKWYTNSAGTGSPVFTGPTYTAQPLVTTTYYVRAEGTCNTTSMRAITVIVSTSGPGTVTITSAPAVGAVGQGGVLTVSAATGAQYYQYTSNLGHISAILFNGQIGPYLTTSNSVNVTFQLPLQNYQIRVIALNACGRSNTASTHIRGTVPQGTSITSSTGNLVACPNQAITYTGAAISGSNLYTWTIIPASAGTITSGQGGLVVNVTWAAGFSGSAQLCYHGQTNFNLAGPDYCVTISTNAPTPGAITGNNQPCQGGSGGYTIANVAGATSYNWTTTIPGASVIGTGTTGSATFPGGTFSGNICVTANTSCGVSAASCMPITSGAAGIPDPIAGPSTGVCNLSGINYSVNAPGATGFLWSSADPNIQIASGGSSNSVLVNFLPGFTSGSLDVDVTYACGTTPASIAINGAPAMPVIAPAIICDGTGIQYFASSQSATQFNWTATGALIESCGNPTLCSQYFIEWDFGGTLSVTAQNTCGVSPAFSAFGSCRLAQLDANVYPNPTSGQATVEFEAAGQTTYSIKVTDLAGRIIINQEVTSVRGLNQVNIDLTDAGKGLYLVHLNGQDGTALVKRLAVE